MSGCLWVHEIANDGIQPGIFADAEESVVSNWLVSMTSPGGSGDLYPISDAIWRSYQDVDLADEAGHRRLRCGDCTNRTDVAALLNGTVPDLMVTDPPYGVDYGPEWRQEAGLNANQGKLGRVLNDHVADWRAAWAAFPGPVAYVWHAGKFASTVQASLEESGFEIRSQLIWKKERFALSRGDYHWQHEPCWYAVRHGHSSGWLGDRTQSTVWEISAREGAGLGHGTQKPVECMRRPIENSSTLSSTIYDPFVGTGTTIIACEQTGRRCLAMELAPEYVDVAVLRWQQFTGQRAILASTGEAFDDIAAARRASGRSAMSGAAGQTDKND